MVRLGTSIQKLILRTIDAIGMTTASVWAQTISHETPLGIETNDVAYREGRQRVAA